MIQANELRIGNWLNMGRYGDSQIGSYNIYQIQLMNKGTKVADYYHETKPIPLTEEWLERFGFKSEGYKKDFIGKDFRSGGMTLDFVLSKPLTKGEWNEFYTYNLESHRYINIEYVHQLMNLFHSITNQELTKG